MSHGERGRVRLSQFLFDGVVTGARVGVCSQTLSHMYTTHACTQSHWESEVRVDHVSALEQNYLQSLGHSHIAQPLESPLAL